MELHVPTMLLMIVIASATLSVSMGAGASRSISDGVLFWSVGFAMHTLAFILLGLRGRISDVASIIVANALLSATFALVAQGMYQFQKRPPPIKLI